jgi:hypothetical protein
MGLGAAEPDGAAAVDDEHLAGDEHRLGVAEEGYRLGDVLGLGEPASRVAGGELADSPGGHAGQHRGADHAGGDGADHDLARAELDREGAGEAGLAGEAGEPLSGPLGIGNPCLRGFPRGPGRLLDGSLRSEQDSAPECLPRREAVASLT